MRKDPERRYASANELRQDIERHFAGQPVLARGNPFGYVAGKFLRRHSGAAIAATLALVSVLAGSVVALREAHVATKASARAENRLHDLVQLANNTLFEVEDDLARQPGATKTRQKIVKSTLDYLDKLAANESGDRELSLALAAGYLKMGDVLGRPHKPNLGDPKGAIASYRMAEKVLAPLRAQGDTLDSAVMRIEIEDRIGGVQFETGTLAEAQKTTEPLLKEIESLAALHPNDKAVLLEQASIYDSMLDIEAIRSYSGAIDWARKSIALYEHVAKLDPADEVALEDLAVGYSNAALALGASPDRQMVTGYVRKSLDIREERVRRHPEDAIARRDLMVIMGRMGDVILGLPDDRTPAVETEALLWYWKAADVARQLMRDDPSNVNARDDYAAVVARAGVVMPHDMGAIRDSLERLREGEQLLRQSLREKPNERLNVVFLCNCYDGEGQRLEVLGRLPEALATADEAYRAASALVVREPNFAAARNRTMMSFKLRIRVLARLGRGEESAAAAREAMRLSLDYAAHGPMQERMVLFRPQVWEWLGEANGILHDSVNSRAAYVRARDEWKLLAATNAAANVPKNIARVEALIAKMP